MIPTLETEHLILNGFTEEDVPAVVKMAGDRNVARTTLNLPHPYKKIDAEKWIASHAIGFVEKTNVVFAVRLKSGGLIGAIGIIIDQAHKRCELGYWIGKKHWNQGYCTEAARAALKYAFKMLKMNKVYARHLSNNPASGRVMMKCGMKQEGRQRQQFIKWGKYVDMVEYGILKKEWLQSRH